MELAKEMQFGTWAAGGENVSHDSLIRVSNDPCRNFVREVF